MILQAARRLSPDGAYRVLADQGIRGKNGERVFNGLADQDAVKRIFVVGREFGEVKSRFIFPRRKRR